MDWPSAVAGQPPLASSAGVCRRLTPSSALAWLYLRVMQVHCTVEPVPDPDVVFPVEFNGVSYQVGRTDQTTDISSSATMPTFGIPHPDPKQELSHAVGP